jgi:sterol desaturase/sphingolipid hydroxylase (fatty acid hydroxylase superfamily)
MRWSLKHWLVFLAFVLAVITWNVGYEYMNDLGRRNGWWAIIFIDTILGNRLNQT